MSDPVRALGVEHIVSADPERIIAGLLRLVQHAADYDERVAVDVIMVGCPTDLGEEVRNVIASALAAHFDVHRAPSQPHARAAGEELTELQQDWR